MPNNFISSKWTDLIHTAIESLSPRPKEAAIVSVDGLMRVTYPIHDYEEIRREEDAVAPMSAAMLSLGERISAELSLSTFQQTIIYGNDGLAILVARDDWVLTTRFKSIDSLDDILAQLRAAVINIEIHAQSLGLTL